jgi:RNA polymerase sigma factor (sigma-70 family)
MSDPRLLLGFIRGIARRGDEGASDGQLLARFASTRDDSAFASLLARHGPMVLGVCRRVLGSPHDAEDAFQATWFVLARRAGSIQRPEALASWLYGVAHRTALEARTRAVRRRAREEPLADAVAPPNTDVFARDLRAVLDGEIRRLPDKYRSPFVLCYLEGRTNEEAARLLCCPKGTILSRLAWARDRLRRQLTRRGVTVPAAGLGALLSVDSLSAAVPAETARQTTQAALRFLAGQRVPVEVITLAKGVLKAMVIDKLKVVSAVILMLGLVGGGSAWLAQPILASAPSQPAPAAAPDDQDKLLDTLVALEKRTWQATKKKDLQTLQKLSTDDFEAILSDGTRLNLKDFQELFPFFQVKSFSMSDTKVVALGPDAAVLIYRSKAKTIVLGMTEEEHTWNSSTWVRRNGDWRCAFYQETSIDD